MIEIEKYGELRSVSIVSAYSSKLKNDAHPLNFVVSICTWLIVIPRLAHSISRCVPRVDETV